VHLSRRMRREGTCRRVARPAGPSTSAQTTTCSPSSVLRCATLIYMPRVLYGSLLPRTSIVLDPSYARRNCNLDNVDALRSEADVAYNIAEGRAAKVVKSEATTITVGLSRRHCPVRGTCAMIQCPTARIYSIRSYDCPSRQLDPIQRLLEAMSS
jgi:hypothetical protein